MSSPAASLPLAAASIADLAEQCVKCGLCLVHCPTYRVMGVEGESPRGRIAYASALDQRAIEPTATLRTQLDDCLACSTCEIVCPTRVRYDDLLVGTRAAIDARQDETTLTRRVRRLAQRRWVWRALQRIRKVPLQWLGRAFPRYARLIATLPALPRPEHVPKRSAASAKTRLGKALLFRGCVASALDADTHAATVKVLTAIGYEVHVPNEAHCCGALDRHAGDVARAEALSAHAARLRDAEESDIIVGTATGCQRDLVAHVDREAVDVFALLAKHESALPPLSPQPLRIAWLAPCTQPHSASPEIVRRMIAKIPGIEWTTLPLQPRCCGAAGVYFVDHAHIADPLRAERVEQIAAIKPDLVLTTNIGCRLHVRAGLLAARLDVPVIHPIKLIADALP